MLRPQDQQFVLITSLGDLFPLDIGQVWAALPRAYNTVELLIRGYLSGALTQADQRHKIGYKIGPEGQEDYEFSHFYQDVRRCFAFAQDDIDSFRSAWNAGVQFDLERVKATIKEIQDAGFEWQVVSGTNATHWQLIQLWCKENGVELPENCRLTFAEKKPYEELLSDEIKRCAEARKMPCILRHRPEEQGWSAGLQPLRRIMGALTQRRNDTLDTQSANQIYWSKSPQSLKLSLNEFRLLGCTDRPTQQEVSSENLDEITTAFVGRRLSGSKGRLEPAENDGSSVDEEEQDEHRKSPVYTGL
ncbi:MAG: hypothetical protein CMF48_07630 [Legionellales bacterium]|nr:hypothetical protein [Legionellales bacterium]|tara:strand:+ start:507 stop:1415 length:909 start_codon:yes stop_codon:yes gene_type:complete